MPEKSPRRRVITGYDDSGEPAVLVDAPAPTTLESAAFDIVETWRFDTLPADLRISETVTGPAALNPDKREVLLRFCHMAPADSIGQTDFKEAMEQMGGGDNVADEAETPGTHTTDTVDHILIVSGEIDLHVGGHVVYLKAGDVVVQNGTPHAWVNRSSEPCVTFAVQVAADPATRHGPA
jgi:mannose-6-phosphate isomerase-like protein (cupin superfamily)